MINTARLGNELVALIKSQSWFPYKSGNLKNNATRGFEWDDDTYLINFSSSIAPYLEALENGSDPHDIPFAFVGRGNFVYWYPYKDGVPFLMGVGGRFNGKFHPGSDKHKGFISDKSIRTIINYICNKYKGECYDIK